MKPIFDNADKSGYYPERKLKTIPVAARIASSPPG